MTPISPKPHWALIAASLIAACSINEVGIVDIERFEGDGAVVYRKTAPGVHFDTRRGASLTLGRYQSITVFATDCDGPPGDAANRLRAAFSTSAPELSIYYTEGLSLIGGADEVGLTLGVREYSLLAFKPEESEFGRHLAFSSEDFLATRLDLLDQKTNCGGGYVEE